MTRGATPSMLGCAAAIAVAISIPVHTARAGGARASSDEIPSHAEDATTPFAPMPRGAGRATAPHREARRPGPTTWATQSYAYQTLMADAAALVIVMGSLENGNEEVLRLGLIAALVGAPVVHVAHGKPGTALGSLGLRVALPAAGLLVGLVTGGTLDEPVTGGLIGLAGGLGGAIAIDAGSLAEEDVEVAAATRLGVAHDGDRTLVMLGGSF